MKRSVPIAVLARSILATLTLIVLNRQSLGSATWILHQTRSLKMKSQTTFLSLLALTLACDSPVAPVLCDDPPPVNAVFGYPVERRVCIASGDVDALSYSAVSSNPEIVAVANADRNLTITAMQEEGGAEITVTVAEGNTTVGTIVYPVVIVPPWSGRITVCNAEYDADEDATYLTVEGEVTAHLNFTNAAAFIYYGGGPVGWAYLGDMSTNQTARIYSSPRGEGDQTGGTCDIDMEYEIGEN